MTESAEKRATALLQIRIIAIALIAGPAMFLAVVFFLRSSGSFEASGGGDQLHDILHWVLLALAMGAVTVNALVPGLMRKSQGGTIESFRAMTIVRLAATEGAALFGTVCFLLSGRPWGAGVTLALLGFALLLQFPTGERLDAWLERADQS